MIASDTFWAHWNFLDAILNKRRSKRIATIIAPITSIAPILSIRLLEPTRSMPLASLTELPLSESASAGQESSSSSRQSALLLIPKKLFKTFVNVSVGINSSRASVLSSLRIIRVVAGTEMSHICMKMRN